MHASIELRPGEFRLLCGTQKLLSYFPRTYYRCASYYHKLITCGFTKRAIQIEKADQAVWNWLSSLLADETVLLEGVRSIAQRREEELEPKREQYAYVLKMLDTTGEKIRRLIDELADFSGSTVKAVIKEKIKQMESEQNFLLEEKSRLEAEIPQLEINPEFERRITEIAAVVRERLPVATFQGMRDLLELLMENQHYPLSKYCSSKLNTPSACCAKKTVIFHLDFGAEIIENARYEMQTLYSLENLKLANIGRNTSR